MMNQNLLSVAIQALFERRDSIQRRTPNNTSAIEECEAAIKMLESMKAVDLMLPKCDFTVEIWKPDNE